MRGDVPELAGPPWRTRGQGKRATTHAEIRADTGVGPPKNSGDPGEVFLALPDVEHGRRGHRRPITGKASQEAARRRPSSHQLELG